MHKCNIASDFAEQAVAEMKDRAASRDCDGERSMERTVNAFNAMFGHKMTTVQGWQFMELLKMARSVGGAYREDDFVDGVAYAALAGEAAADAAAGFTGVPAFTDEDVIGNAMAEAHSANVLMEGDPNGGQLGEGVTKAS
ncbi:hypothetical protein phiV141_24 [Vibrio phage phiV141]|uniref:DUF6378 domain-containing protein n=1 Tax=Vibrio phage phiV141 TaxID=2723905 RepID=A0A7D7EM16_9CAUD|nr:hypothetical protein phiV141_24 [Vibrio phage phiV141]